MAVVLTKSQYLIGRHCAKRLWLARFRNKEAAPPSKGDEMRMRAGDQLGRMAQELFPGGSAVVADRFDQVGQLEETRRMMEAGASVLFEASFTSGDLLARCDVLVKEGAAWKIVEVKSSTKVKDEHVEDLAFQVYVLRSAGLEVSSAVLCRIDSTQERGSDQLSPQELFVFEDLTELVEKAIPAVADWASRFLRTLDSEASPEVQTNVHCTSPVKCPFYAYCHRDTPKYDLVNLPGIKAERVLEFRESGHLTIGQIPEGAGLTPQQSRVWEVVRFDRPFVGEGLTTALSGIQFPAHFIDFEATGPALPEFPGLRPYQAFPFQWSDHRLLSFDAEPDHEDYLSTDGGDPRVPFAESLHARISEAATIVFYSSYELTTVRALAKAKVPYAKELVSLLESRGIDLYKVVKEHVYLAGFEGSYSIKKVLPALVPDLAYDALDIRDGDTAAVEYLRMHAPGTTEAEQAKIAKALRDYCAVDTLAMVRLYQALLQLSSP